MMDRAPRHRTKAPELASETYVKERVARRIGRKQWIANCWS